MYNRKAVIPEFDDPEFKRVKQILKEYNYNTIGDLIDLTKSKKQINEVAKESGVTAEKVKIYTNKSVEDSLKETEDFKRETIRSMIQIVKNSSIVKSWIHIILSLLLFSAGGYFIYQFLEFGADSIADSALLLADSGVTNVFLSDAFWQLAVYLLYLIVGFGFILYGFSILQQKVLIKNFSGISQIQHEFLSGMGETRPLVQVIQETLTNANKTFSLSLVISKTLFWTGFVFISIALFQILVLGRTSYAQVGVGQVEPVVNTATSIANTATSGIMGILSWIVSALLSQRKKIQDSLDNITQLEFVLVGLAKQFSVIDLYVSDDSKHAESKLTRSTKEISDNVLRSLTLVELYTKTYEDKGKILGELMKKKFNIK